MFKLMRLRNSHYSNLQRAYVGYIIRVLLKSSTQFGNLVLPLRS